MIFTAGHSTLSQDDFVNFVKSDISTIIDVRSHPSSRWPQFVKSSLEQYLPQNNIKYEWMPGLGGWTESHYVLNDKFLPFGVDLSAYSGQKFPKQRIAAKLEAQSVPSWTNQGLYDYSWFMSTPEFIDAAESLIEKGKNENVCIICCEAQWWQCHRSMISDYCSFRNVETYHLMPKFRQKNKVKYIAGAYKKPHGNVITDRIQRYDGRIKNEWVSRINVI